MKNKTLSTNVAEDLIEQALNSGQEKMDTKTKAPTINYKEEYEKLGKLHKLPFPVDSFPEVTRKTIKSWNRCSNLPIEYFALTVLTTASTMIGNRVKIKINSRWSESPMLYSAIIGPNGIGKSAVWGYALQPVNELQKRYAKDLHQRLLDYKAELGERAATKRSTADLEEPKENLIKIDKTSMEFMMEAMWKNPHGLLLFRDELKGWLMSMNQYRAGDDLQAFLEFWNNVDKSKRIKQNSYNIDRTFINILGAIQPELIKSMATGENVANGLFQRFLFAYPYEFKRGKYSETEPDTFVQNTYMEIMKYISDLPSRIIAPESDWDIPCFDYVMIEMTPEAKREWIKYHDVISDKYNEQDDSNVAGVSSKHDRHCARLALIVRFIRLAEQNHSYDKDSLRPDHITWFETPEDLTNIKIEVQDIQSAILMSQYFHHQSLRILDKVGNPAKALSRERQMLYKALPTEFTIQEALNQIEEIKEEVKGFKMSKRTLQRLLNGEDGDLFHRGHRGYYSKKWEL